MSNYSASYWKIHKILFNQLLDKLDIDIQKKIIADPESEDAVLFAAVVDKAVQAHIEFDK